MAYPCLCTGRSKEFLCRLPNLRPQEDHGDQVWNGQEAKSNVLNRPDHIAFQGSAEDAEAREDILELFSDRAPKHIVQSHKAEIPLTHQGGRREQQETGRKHIPHRRPYTLKGVQRQYISGDPGSDHPSDAQHQAGDRANNKCIQEYLCYTGNSLLGRVLHIRILREEYRFNGYIHAKAIPGAAPELVEQLGLLADRLSCNIELPSETGLRTLAPEKTKAAVLAPMRQIQVRSIQNKEELVKYRHTPKFAPAGQSTQMIVGATPDSDLHILRLTQGLYDRYQLKRVFFSAYVPVVESALLPSKETKPPLLREHRLYQADWLLRFYGFRAEELLDEQTPSFDPRLDPKCCWALRHPDFFPVEVNRADYEALLRVPGLGVVSARRILTARRTGPLRLENLPKLGVVMKRAQYFLTANGRMADGLRFTQDSLLRNLIAVEQSLLPQPEMRQLSLFDDAV